jgi:hypothetical protein
MGDDMDTRWLVVPLAAVVFALAPASALAQNKTPPADVPGASSAPTESALAVGALRIGSAPNLEVAGFDISVADDSVLYSYYLKNTGTANLAVAAIVPMPELQTSYDGSQTWTLAANDPENPVRISVTAADAPMRTKAEVHAYALDIDRVAEIKAEHLPLIPFGPAADKALAALSPEAADRLAALGIVSPRDPNNPKEPVTADWSLDVLHSWRLELPAGKTTPIIVKFTPIIGHYRVGKGDEQNIADLKDEVCLKPQVMTTLQSRLKGNGAWNVTEISLATDLPAHFIDSAPPSLSVKRPKPDAIVAFCGMDDKTASRPVVLGAASDGSNELRIVIFEPAAK